MTHINGTAYRQHHALIPAAAAACTSQAMYIPPAVLQLSSAKTLPGIMLREVVMLVSSVLSFAVALLVEGTEDLFL